MNCINGIIYEIWNTVNLDLYIAATTKSTQKIMIEHKKACINESDRNIPLYKLMNEVGIGHFHCRSICNVSGDSFEDLRHAEYLFRRRFATVNKHIENITLEEWLAYNKDTPLLHNNTEDVQKVPKHYEQMENKDTPTTKCTCECGLPYTLANKIRHMRTKVHRNRMRELHNFTQA